MYLTVIDAQARMADNFQCERLYVAPNSDQQWIPSIGSPGEFYLDECQRIVCETQAPNFSRTFVYHEHNRDKIVNKLVVRSFVRFIVGAGYRTSFHKTHHVLLSSLVGSVHGVVRERVGIHDEDVIRIPCIDLESDVHLSPKREEEERAWTGRRVRGRTSFFVYNRRMGPAVVLVLENSCNDSWTGLICVQSGSKREKGKRRRALMLTVQLEVPPRLFDEYCYGGPSSRYSFALLSYHCVKFSNGNFFFFFLFLFRINF